MNHLSNAICLVNVALEGNRKLDLTMTVGIQFGAKFEICLILAKFNMASPQRHQPGQNCTGDLVLIPAT